jgi:hypothetical protein
MTRLHSSWMPAKPLTRGTTEMAAKREGVRDADVVLYSIEERVSLWSMSDDDFYSRFRDFSYLLVEQHGRTVVAASHSGNCPEMLEEFLGQNPTAVTRDLIFWSGPKALARAVQESCCSSGISSTE